MSFFVTPVTDEWGEVTYNLTAAGYTALALLIIIVFLAGNWIYSARHKSRKSVKQLVFSAAAIALAFVLSMITIFKMPMGGSVTLLSMFFITVIGYWYGLSGGLTAALAYGLLQLIIDPYILSFPQMLTDYILAFGALGLSGIFSNRKYGLQLGYLAGIIGRFIFSFLSGLIFFGIYAADYNMSPWLYSFCYNGLYIGAEGLITLIIISIPPVSKALARVKNMAVTVN